MIYFKNKLFTYLPISDTNILNIVNGPKKI